MSQLTNVQQGLGVLSIYGGDAVEADHDIIYVTGLEKQSIIPKETRLKLSQLGWFWSDEHSCWAINV